MVEDLSTNTFAPSESAEAHSRRYQLPWLFLIALQKKLHNPTLLQLHLEVLGYSVDSIRHRTAGTKAADQRTAHSALYTARHLHYPNNSISDNNIVCNSISLSLSLLLTGVQLRNFEHRVWV